MIALGADMTQGWKWHVVGDYHRAIGNDLLQKSPAGGCGLLGIEVKSGLPLRMF